MNVETKNFKVLFVYPNLMLQSTFPMALALFSAILKDEGYGVDIFDTTFYQTEDVTSDEARVENLQIAKYTLGEEFSNLPDKKKMRADLVAKVEEYEPDLIALSIIEDVAPLAAELVEAVKHFKIPTLAGGIFPTFAPEQVIALDGVDFVCIGEGEDALLELCDKLRAGEDCSGIENLWVKNADGTVVKNHLRPLKDIDKNPPPDFELFDDRRFYKPMKGKVYRMGLVETNRGCPFTCNYCNSYSQGKLYKEEQQSFYFRNRDIGVIRDEIKLLVDRFKVEFIYFPAEVFFAAPKDYLREFAKMYKEFQVPFFCQNRAEVTDEETSQLLAGMNCHSVALGIEHGNEAFREKMLTRKVTNETYLKALKTLEDTDIKVSVNNIIGFPDETRELVFDTIELNRQFNVYQINAYYFTPYHGTELRDYCVEKGYIDKDTHVSCVTKETVLKMPEPYLSQSDIKGLVRTFNLYARFPRERFPEIAVAERFDEAGNAAFERLREEYWKDFLK
jgi:radical SAM superfamily enzyme YgiQ (UPF0313 family)